ncbi:hypothetical protein ROJ8625_00359 [Roseivivax jejudonensis]|uniref:Uncharacterized protein n=1 Tax=Roseivivax jejudonensis TaxID=1529041 RepID=A0A1X6Y842_9RHOB|nr:hypothetical protein ROJ8625_00359 [Roseivivax jejudonensis]
MLGWMQRNAELLNVFMSLVLMCVWVASYSSFSSASCGRTAA